MEGGHSTATWPLKRACVSQLKYIITCHSSIKNKDHPAELDSGVYEGCHTIYEAYVRTVKRIPNHKQLGSRNLAKEGQPYEWLTFKEVFELQADFARGKSI